MKLSLQKTKFFASFILMICFIGVNSLNSQIAIETQPESSQTLCEGASSTLNLSVTISSAVTNVTYIWKHNGVIVGGNTPNYTKTGITDADTGEYIVEIYNNADITDFVISDPANVNVNKMPSIVTQPTAVAKDLCEGDSLMLTAEVENATIVWYKDGNVLAIDTNTYKMPSVSAMDSGYYYIVAKAMVGCDNATSDSVMVKVYNAVKIVTEPVGANLIPNANLRHVMRVVATGNGPLSYQWYKDGLPMAGQNLDSLVIYAYTSSDSGQYFVQVTGSSPCNATVSSKKVLVGTTYCPIVVVQPPSEINTCVGSSFNIEVQAVGASGYQWIKNGVPLNGAVYTRYSVASATGDEAGTYKLNLIPNPGVTCPQTNSNNVVVKVSEKPAINIQPEADGSCSATSHTLTVNTSNADQYQWYVDGVAQAGATTNTFTVNDVTSTAKTVYVDVSSTYCPAVSSNTILVRQLDPKTMAHINYSDNLNLVEQCTDDNGWSYYSDSANVNELLIAIRKGKNTVDFNPSIMLTGGVMYEFGPNNEEQKGAIMGLRMFNIALDSGQILKYPYDVKFYFDREERNKMFGRATDIKKLLADEDFYTEMYSPDTVNIMMSTDINMSNSLISNIQYPMPFNYAIVNSFGLGVDNTISYIEIYDLFMSNGGGVMYYDYIDKSYAGINGTDLNSSVSLYPNPATEVINIEVPNKNKEYQIAIYNALGAKVYDEVSKSPKAQIDVKGFATGNYILMVNSEKESISKKFSVK